MEAIPDDSSETVPSRMFSDSETVERCVVSAFWTAYGAWVLASLVLLDGTGYSVVVLVPMLVIASIMSAVTFGLIGHSWRTDRTGAVATTACVLVTLAGLMTLQLLIRSRPGWPQSVAGFDPVFYLTVASAGAWVISAGRLMFGSVRR